MSAFVVDKAHIDALVTAGLVLPMRSGYSQPLRWFDRRPTEDELRDTYQAGEPWGPGSVRWYETHRRELTKADAGRVGAMLWAENVRSVNHRYDEGEWEEPYVWRMLAGRPDPLIVLRALSCYEYQSCEHPDWETSEAKAFCDALRLTCCDELTESVEVWEITSADVFVTAEASK